MIEQTLHKRILDATDFIEKKAGKELGKPQVGIVLGSGLGQYAERIQNPITISYSEIPHFLPTSVEGHEGRLIIGAIGGTRPTRKNTSGDDSVSVAVFQGRLHYYEGHSMEDVVFPVRVLCALGIKTLLLTNAAGGINPSFRETDLMMITDHINLMGNNPLRGPNLKPFGPRFPDLTQAYDKGCQAALRAAAASLELELREGVYAALAGPSYETPAEIRMLRTLGADAVGMSTVPESIAARHFGVKVAALSCITNLAAGMTRQKLSHQEVIANAAKGADRLLALLDKALPSLAGLADTGAYPLKGDH